MGQLSKFSGLEYGKMSYNEYCDHGFAKKNKKGRIICGYCTPEEFEAAVKRSGKRLKVGYQKRILVPR